MSDDTSDTDSKTKVSWGKAIKEYVDSVFPTVDYADYNQQSVAQINDKFEEKTLTDKQRLCYHKFKLVGRSPVLDEEWWNCEYCGIAKEEYEAIEKKQRKKRAIYKPTGEIWM